MHQCRENQWISGVQRISTRGSKEAKAQAHLMGDWVKLSKELSHGNGLWVHCPEDDLLLLIIPFLIHESQSVSQDV